MSLTPGKDYCKIADNIFGVLSVYTVYMRWSYTYAPVCSGPAVVALLSTQNEPNARSTLIAKVNLVTFFFSHFVIDSTTKSGRKFVVQMALPDNRI